MYRKASENDEKPVVVTTCAFNDHGVSCGKPGILSEGTLGKGPWYCRQHAWVFLGDRGPIERVVSVNVHADAVKFCAEHGLDTVPKMREFIRTGMQGMSAKPGNLDWARRIMTRAADGENMPKLSISKSKESLGIYD